jgi:hypothetical protein
METDKKRITILGIIILILGMISAMYMEPEMYSIFVDLLKNVFSSMI